MLNSQQDRMLHLEHYGAADVGKLFQPEKRFKEGAECKCEENDNFQEFSPFCRSTFFKRIYKYMGIYMYMYMYIMIRPRDCDKDNRQRRQEKVLQNDLFFLVRKFSVMCNHVRGACI